MQPISLVAHGVAVLILTVAALFLFTRDRIPLESSSLTILIILVAGFELFPYTRDGETVIESIDFFAGFGSEAPAPSGASTRVRRDPAVHRNTWIDRAVANGDDHVIKGTEACLAENAPEPAPEYPPPALRAITTLGPAP